MKARAAFWSGLSSLLGAGIPIRPALAQLSEGSRGAFGRAVRTVSDDVEGGRPLAESLAAHPHAFRRHEVEIMRAAEMNGRLDEAAGTLGEAEERADKARGRLLASLAYPAVVIHFVPIPLNISRLVNDGVLSFAMGWLTWIFPLWLAVGVAVYLFRSPATRETAGRFVATLPFLGGILTDLAWVRWARTFAALEEAGVPADACVIRSSAVVGLPHLEVALASPEVAVRHGTTRWEAFEPVPLPGNLRQALKQGEHSGTIGPSLNKQAELMEHAALTRLETVISLAPVAAIVLAGAAVLYAALSIMGGYYSQLDKL
ncbi:MAG: type II secretion system F family protein [Planctomycetota bacterium]|jgi:type II secretory pathway component PulF